MLETRGIIAGVFLALFLTVIGLVYWNHHQSVKSAQAKVELSEAKASISQLDTSLKINDEVVTRTVKAIKANSEQKQKTLQEVDNTTRQVEHEEITPADADAAYLNSMWSTYCTYNKGESDCASRQSSDSVHH